MNDAKPSKMQRNKPHTHRRSLSTSQASSYECFIGVGNKKIKTTTGRMVVCRSISWLWQINSNWETLVHH